MAVGFHNILVLITNGQHGHREMPEGGRLPQLALHQPKLIPQLQEAILGRHYSLRTLKSYVHWVRICQGLGCPDEPYYRHPQ